MRKIASMAAVAAAALLAACGQSVGEDQIPGWRSAEVSIGSAPQQRFQGFGFSLDQDGPYGTLDEADRAEVDRLLYGELGTRVLRLWYGAGEPRTVHDAYQASGVIDHAFANGVREILLTPWIYVGDPERQARLIARDLRTLRDDYGIKITATGVLNEPEGGPGDEKYLPYTHYTRLAIAMRRELDAQGLGEVTVLGPEFASADDLALEWIDMIAHDPAALRAVDAFASHSYNMAATPEHAERARRHGKQYWMTEAGGGVADGSAEFDHAFAADAAARFLNDLNNGVTHWIWFLGLGEGTEDVYQKLVMCEGSCANPRRIYTNAAYPYLRRIALSFVPGTVLRHLTSDLSDSPDMVYTYGAKPPLNAAAGLRPDGRWALAVVDDTSGASWSGGSWDAPTNYRITLDVPELANRESVTFEVCRTGPAGAERCGETLEMTGGRISFDLWSLELDTLIAREPVS